MGKTPGQQPQAPLPRVRASPYGESCSPVRMSLPHMPPQPSVFDRPNKIPPPIELHLLQESRVAEERTSLQAPPPDRLHQEPADRLRISLLQLWRAIRSSCSNSWRSESFRCTSTSFSSRRWRTGAQGCKRLRRKSKRSRISLSVNPRS